MKNMFPQFAANQQGPTTRFYTATGREIWWYSDGNPYVTLDPLSHDLAAKNPSEQTRDDQ